MVDNSCLDTSSANACYDTLYRAYQAEVSLGGLSANAASAPVNPVAVGVPVAVGGTALLGAAVAVPLALRARKRRERRGAGGRGGGGGGGGGDGPGPRETEYQPAWSM